MHAGAIAKTAEGAEELYDDWVGHYDASLKRFHLCEHILKACYALYSSSLRSSWEYPAPSRVAEILLQEGLEKGNTARVLDLGCGTGMSGEALAEHGFEGPLTGVDISQLSLDYIETEKPGVYASTVKG